MAETKSLAHLSGFFQKPDATAIIVTDCKLDDAICLWYFFSLNFSRPAGHKVEIKVFVIGVKDSPGAEALAKHVFQQAKAHAAKTRRNPLPVNVKLSVFASKNAGPPDQNRFELDTFGPYNAKRPGFPRAKKE